MGVIDAFRDTFRNHLTGETASNPLEILMEVLEKHPDILQQDENRKFIQAYLVKLSTDSLLENVTKDEFNIAERNALMLSFLEVCDFTKQNPFDSLNSKDLILKHMDLFNGCKRSLVKFYRKRIPCHCLDEAHAELKPQSKTGVCSHCGERFERKFLKECSICELEKYCSKDCQIAHWPQHKKKCKIWSQNDGTKAASPVSKNENPFSTPAADDAMSAPAGAP